MAGERIRLGRGTWEGAIREVTTQRVSIGNIDRILNDADVFAETTAILTDYKRDLNNAGFQPTSLNTIADPPPDTTVPPTADEIQAQIELTQAFDTVMEVERTRIWDLVEAEYNNISTTAEPFRRYTDLKHLRQRG